MLGLGYPSKCVLPYLQLLLQLPLLFSVYSDGEVLGRFHRRVTRDNLVGVKRPLQCVPLICCVQHPEVGLLNHLQECKWTQRSR